MLSKLRRHVLPLVALGSLLAPPIAAHTRITTDINWGNDIRPILRQHCMRCHSPGGIAPDYADFTTYGTDSKPGARAWATAIEEEILTGRMPPWTADPRFDQYRNSRRLTQREIDMISAWVNGGAPQGPRRDLPPPQEFVDEWLLGPPDLVVEPAEEHVLPSGQWDDRITVAIPLELEADTWITGYEFKPDRPRTVYSISAYIVDPPGKPESLEVEVQVPYDPFRPEDEPEPTRWREMDNGRRFLGQWLRGDEPVLYPDGAGRRLRSGSTIELEIAYERQEMDGDSEEIRDRSRVGLFLAQSEDEVDRILESEQAAIDDLRLRAKRAKKPFRAHVTVDEDGHLVGLSPRFGDHLSNLEVVATYPDSRSRTLLLIPEYDPTWPASYRFEEPIEIRAGTRVEMVGEFEPPEGKQKLAQAFELHLDYVLDNHLVLPEPPPEATARDSSSRGGMLVDLFGSDTPGLGGTAPSGAPNDPNAAAHMDHSPLHGGQFFMAANQYHHLEGALPKEGEFRFYVYDDYKRPVDPRNFAGRAVFEEFDEESGEFTETEFPLTAVAGTDYLIAEIPPALPAEFFASVWLAGEETRFDFYFEETTVEPVGAPRGFAVTRAGPHSHERPPLTIPDQPQAIVDTMVGRTAQLVERVESKDWLTLYVPAFDAKDLAEALLNRLDGLAVRDRGKVRRGVSRVMQSAVEIERAGDLADEPRVRRALDRFQIGLTDIVDVFPTGGR